MASEAVGGQHRPDPHLEKLTRVKCLRPPRMREANEHKQPRQHMPEQPAEQMSGRPREKMPGQPAKCEFPMQIHATRIVSKQEHDRGTTAATNTLVCPSRFVKRLAKPEKFRDPSCGPLKSAQIHPNPLTCRLARASRRRASASGDVGTGFSRPNVLSFLLTVGRVLLIFNMSVLIINSGR